MKSVILHYVFLSYLLLSSMAKYTREGEKTQWKITDFTDQTDQRMLLLRMARPQQLFLVGPACADLPFYAPNWRGSFPTKMLTFHNTIKHKHYYG